ncbi:hypothetical protein [Nonomuraea sp. LPB2021202275-12-8]|uniref:hypothetical protein n=1 Tax=Nonomuraea sp. LPB2021202275-12-8 TaxID=3120159 RepID=UPI00300C8F8F
MARIEAVASDREAGHYLAGVVNRTSAEVYSPRGATSRIHRLTVDAFYAITDK